MSGFWIFIGLVVLGLLVERGLVEIARAIRAHTREVARPSEAME